MKILIIDNLFAPNLKGKFSNGVQKFSKTQMELLSKKHDCHYITASGSDIQFPNQHVLSGWFDISLEEKKDKIAQTRKLAQEIKAIIQKIDPDVVLDNSCKHLTSIWDCYKNGIVFEHYFRPFTVINQDTIKKFNDKGVFWCGVSQHQNKNFNNLFHDTICIHYVNEPPKEVKPAKPYGVFVGRWDGGKNPHTALKNYLKSGSPYPVECFIKFGGVKIPDKELEFLQASQLMKFHIDASRETILNLVSEAMFGLGMGNESTGIVSLEYASYGVPYIVPGNKSIAEQEHIPKEALFFCDRSLEENIPSQIKKSVDFCSQISYNDRIKLSQYIVGKYTADHFIAENNRIIQQAMNKFSKGNLEWFIK